MRFSLFLWMGLLGSLHKPLTDTSLTLQPSQLPLLKAGDYMKDQQITMLSWLISGW